VQLTIFRKKEIYLMGNISSLPIHFQNLTPNRLPNIILELLLLEKCPQLVDFPSIFFPVLSNHFLAVTNTILKENTSSMCASCLQFGMVGFSLCISSRNLIIANFCRCVRSLLSETHLTFNFYLNVIAASVAQAPSQFTSK
jgi:hypothetical protein